MRMYLQREEGTQMTVLIAYASKHGSTQGIAERIAEKLRQLGKEAEARSVDAVEDPGSYEAFVIGSAVYYGSWLKEAIRINLRTVELWISEQLIGVGAPFARI